MKTNLFAKGVILCVALMVIFTGISSFTVKRKVCAVSCTWNAVQAGMTGLALTDCSGMPVGGSAVLGSTFTGSMGYFGCTQVWLTTGLTSPHIAGTIYIYRNGTLVRSHAVARNSTIAFDEPFDAICGDVFSVVF
jgi:hypothetical protein